VSKATEITALKNSPFRDLFQDLDVQLAQRGHESDKFSEGGSDSESSEEDVEVNFFIKKMKICIRNIFFF
jgi:hypothetical protein